MIALLLSTSELAVPAEGGGFNPLEFAPGAAFWTIVCFVAALPFMWKFVFGPITNALVNRDLMVEEALVAARTAREEAERQAADTKAELQKAQHEAHVKVQQATERAEKAGQDALARAKAEADRQLQAAREEIEAQKTKALLEIRREVVNLSIQAAGKILERDVDDEAHRKFVSEFMEAAGK